MVVKDKRGRRRYIAFRMAEGKVSDEVLLSFIKNTASARGLKPPKVIQFNGLMGILRTSDMEKDRIVEALNEGPGRHITTLRTSGTIKTLREMYFTSPSETNNDRS